MIDIMYKMLVLFKNHLNYLKDSIFCCFFKEYLEEEKIIKDIRNLSRLGKLKELKVEYLVILRIFFSMKKKININQREQIIFVVTIILNTKVTVIEIKRCQLNNIFKKLDHI